MNIKRQKRKKKKKKKKKEKKKKKKKKRTPWKEKKNYMNTKENVHKFRTI